MKKLTALLLGVLLLVNIVACATPIGNTDSTTNTTTTTASTASTSTLTTTTTSPSSAQNGDSQEGSGGYGLEVYDYADDYKFSGIGNFFLSHVRKTMGDDFLYKTSGELDVKRNTVPRTYTGSSIQFWVFKANIPQEKFVELNNKGKDFYKDSTWNLEHCTFTDEEIDDIYNLTTAEFNKKYKASTAVLVGEVIYSFDWFYENDIDLWQKQNFTVAQLQEAVDNAKKMENFPQGIAEAVEKKLNDYIAAVGAQAVE